MLSFPLCVCVYCCMYLLQVTLVAMVNNILSINHPKLVTHCSVCTLSVLYVCAVSLSACDCFSLIHDSMFFFNLFLWKERTFPSLPFPLLCVLLSLSLSLSLSLPIVLFCLTFLQCSCFIVHENFNCRACIWSRVWWQSFGKVHLSDDGVFLLLLAFSPFVFEGVHRTSWVACRDFICLIVSLIAVDLSILQWQRLYFLHFVLIMVILGHVMSWTKS